MNRQSFIAQRPVIFALAIPPTGSGFIDYGQELRLISGEGGSEQFVPLRDNLPGGLMLSAVSGKISVMPGHHRANMDDDTTEAWGSNGPAYSCDFFYQPPCDESSEELKPLELWAEVDGELTCIERLEWVVDCLRIVGKEDLGYFGDIVISGRSVEAISS
ncbi:hypothetical protein RYA05_02840 [Pseudomonas syringae pv. actinidiae]|nr:hypothetical protein [Pseudomonas syringae pv. actinidiae]